MRRRVYLLASESKDVFSLEAFADSLRLRDLDVVVAGFCEELLEAGGGAVGRLLKEPSPIVVASSTQTIEYLSVLRPRESYILIGVEHGTAPYKAATYRSQLLDADYYLAPTRLWHDRLARLYPQRKHKLRLGGYPRVEVLRDLRDAALKTGPGNEVAAAWFASNTRNLVILSWGVSEWALRRLPDRNDVVYLLHPGDARLGTLRLFDNATVVISEPTVTAALLSQATSVFGDFSSLTLEAHALGIPIRVVLDRSLYFGSVDLSEDFFDPQSPAYAAVPHTGLRLPHECIIDAKQLAWTLESGTVLTNVMTIPLEMLIPAERDNRELTAECIEDIERCHPASRNDILRVDFSRLETARHVVRGYHDLLGRVPDFQGFKSYVDAFSKSSDPPTLRAFKWYAEICGSAEGRDRLAAQHWPWPTVDI